MNASIFLAIKSLVFIVLVSAQSLLAQNLNQTDSLGRRQGHWIYYERPIELRDEYYQDGLIQGTSKLYNTFNEQKPRLIQEIEFENGVRHGYSTRYCGYPKGTIWSKYYFEHGKLQGEQLDMWYGSNSLACRQMYKNDTLYDYRCYDNNGKLKLINIVKNGMRTDTFLEYDKKEVLRYIVVKNKREFVHFILNEKGQIIRKWDIKKCLPPPFKNETGTLYSKKIKNISKRRNIREFVMPDDPKNPVPYKDRKRYFLYIKESGDIKNKECTCEHLNPE